MLVNFYEFNKISLNTMLNKGFLSVPSIGSGTANTEFECITGMNLNFFGFVYLKMSLFCFYS